MADVETHLHRWQEAGVLDSVAASRIRAWESEQKHPSGLHWQGLVALILGAILLAGGVALFVSAHWDQIVAVNLTSAYRLIRSMEPLLRRSEAGRAIVLTTGVAERPRAFWGAYAATKAGLEALVRCWADEIESTPIRAVLLDPNVMRTRMRAEAFPGEDPETLPHPSEIGPMIVELAAKADLGLPKQTMKFSAWKAAASQAARA